MKGRFAYNVSLYNGLQIYLYSFVALVNKRSTYYRCSW